MENSPILGVLIGYVGVNVVLGVVYWWNLRRCQKDRKTPHVVELSSDAKEFLREVDRIAAGYNLRIAHKNSDGTFTVDQELHWVQEIQ